MDDHSNNEALGADRERDKPSALWVLAAPPLLLVLYILSSGPVAWATNDAFHPRYLPDALNLIYLPLLPVAKFQPANRLLYWWTATVWQGSPAGYTTL